MESKNIKIVDEHGIDRVANVVCSIDVDGSDYVIYWIERDNDNDNLFVSKILKNNDGTSTMTNIEDSAEKSNLSEIVKELVTHAINDEKDVIDVESVSLKNGKSVKISNVLFNKEQNINVQKTYITTVKKSVTKVSEKYYHVDASPEVAMEEVTPFVEPVPEPVVQTPEVAPIEMPSLDEVTTHVSEPEVAVPDAPVLETAVAEVSPSVVSPVVETPVQQVESEPVVAIPEVPTVAVPEVVAPVTTEKPSEPEVTPVVEEPNIDARINIIGASPAPVEPVSASVSPVVEENVAAPTVPPIPPVMPAVEPVVSSMTPPVVNPSASQNELFFDGSKETNLSGVFSGNTDDTQPVVTTETVAPIREFGQDEPVIPLAQNVEPAVEDAKTLTRSPGFANSKFFMVIALAFFIASCVFLGYEVFRFVQMR